MAHGIHVISLKLCYDNHDRVTIMQQRPLQRPGSLIKQAERRRLEYVVSLLHQPQMLGIVLETCSNIYLYCSLVICKKYPRFFLTVLKRSNEHFVKLCNFYLTNLFHSVVLSSCSKCKSSLKSALPRNGFKPILDENRYKNTIIETFFN